MRTHRGIFHSYARIEERMLRALMPRTSAADSVGLREPVRRPLPSAREAKGLTFTLAEVR